MFIEQYFMLDNCSLISWTILFMSPGQADLNLFGAASKRILSLPSRHRSLCSAYVFTYICAATVKRKTFWSYRGDRVGMETFCWFSTSLRYHTTSWLQQANPFLALTGSVLRTFQNLHSYWGHLALYYSISSTILEWP